MTYSQLMSEFPTFDTAYLPAIPNGFRDQSWHNDACPCFINDERRLALYVDFFDMTARDYAQAPRYSLVRLDEAGECRDEDGNIDLQISTEDWHEILAALA